MLNVVPTSLPGQVKDMVESLRRSEDHLRRLTQVLVPRAERGDEAPHKIAWNSTSIYGGRTGVYHTADRMIVVAAWISGDTAGRYVVQAGADILWLVCRIPANSTYAFDLGRDKHLLLERGLELQVTAPTNAVWDVEMIAWPSDSRFYKGAWPN